MTTQESAPTTAFDNKFLRIINEGINNIILNLKQELDKKGSEYLSGNEKTNAAVSNILNLFTNLQDNIDYKDYKDTDIEQKTGTLYNTLNSVKDTTVSSFSDIQPINTLDEITGELDKNDLQNLLSLNGNPNDINTLNNRLKNCQTLEKLYLKKHEEIIKIFGFVLNLFDKYKYAIKVILFLLKNLHQNGTTEEQKKLDNNTTDGKVKLPKTLINNIGLLLKDQENIQSIIKNMGIVVNNTDDIINNQTTAITSDLVPTKSL